LLISEKEGGCGGLGKILAPRISRPCLRWQNPRPFRHGCCHFCGKPGARWGFAGTIIQDFGADAVLGMGGFTSLPPVYAGPQTWPEDVHSRLERPARQLECDDQPLLHAGLPWLGAAASAYFPKRETVVTGTPVRPEIIKLPSREEGGGFV
jgi:hypothetical protein